MNIGLLRCDRVPKKLLPIAGDYPDAFKKIFSPYAADLSLKTYDVQRGEFPGSPNECDGYLTTGSRFSVYDKKRWNFNLQSFIRSLYENKIKFVGICFGHQLIAEALDGKCSASDQGWGIGVKKVKIVKKQPWMQPELESYNLLVSHLDQVSRLPNGFEVVGTNEHCPYSMMATSSHFLGIQAHPEFTPAYAEALMVSRIDQLGEDSVRRARKTLKMPLHAEIITRWIRNFFLL